MTQGQPTSGTPVDGRATPADSSVAPAGAAKDAVRRELRARRREIAAGRDLVSDAAALCSHGLALAESLGVGAGSTVLLYESHTVEPPVLDLVAALLERGVRVLLPITEPDFDLDWFDAADPDRGPLGRGAVSEADLALVPGLAVDRHGTRMGQGGGCYDRALPRLRSHIRRVVVLHPGESADPADPALPRDPHDEPVDAVLTADGLTTPAHPGRSVP